MKKILLIVLFCISIINLQTIRVASKEVISLTSINFESEIPMKSYSKEYKISDFTENIFIDEYSEEYKKEYFPITNEINLEDATLITEIITNENIKDDLININFSNDETNYYVSNENGTKTHDSTIFEAGTYQLSILIDENIPVNTTFKIRLYLIKNTMIYDISKPITNLKLIQNADEIPTKSFQKKFALKDFEENEDGYKSYCQQFKLPKGKFIIEIDGNKKLENAEICVALSNTDIKMLSDLSVRRIEINNINEGFFNLEIFPMELNFSGYNKKLPSNLNFNVRVYVVDSNISKKKPAQFFMASSTPTDNKAVLSSCTFYYNGLRIPYLLEDGGEFYLRMNLNILHGKGEDIDFPFYNVKWTSLKNVGYTMGNIKKKPKEEYESKNIYIINNQEYVKLSDLFDNWFTELSYDKTTKTFYSGRKPNEFEKEDVIYNYVKKITKGRKTNEEKVKAVHDSIVLHYEYDIKGYTKQYYNLQKFTMLTSQSSALAMLYNKKGICRNYASLFQECMDRLFIPTETILGDAGGGLHVWNKVYLNNKWNFIDVTFADYKNNKYKKASDISRKYYLKTAKEFEKTHMWAH